MDKKNKYKRFNLEKFKTESKPIYVTAKTDKKVTVTFKVDESW